jgi:hypothetical protein
MTSNGKGFVIFLLAAGLHPVVYGKTICSVEEMDAAFKNVGAENRMLERENVHRLKSIIEELAQLQGLNKAQKSDLLMQYTLANSGYREQDKRAIMQRVTVLLSQAGTENNPDCDKLTEAAGVTEELIGINREQWEKILAGAERDLREARNAQ